MKILYVTRKFPPSVGGMETVAYELFKTLQAESGCEVELVASGRSNTILPLIYPYLLLRALLLGALNKPDIIYIQDGVLAPLGYILRIILRRPTVITVHGLELTYNNLVYNVFFKRFIALQTHIVCISRNTKSHFDLLFGQRENVSVIGNGINDTQYNSRLRADDLINKLSSECGVQLDPDSKVIFTVGRLVERKGIAWFINHAMTSIVESNKRSDVVYLVAGDGEQRVAIKQAITESDLSGSVYLLGRVSNELLSLLYNCGDIFVMPNIRVKGDVEGFGVVALEASSCGTPVIAAGIEGIVDAVVDGKTGHLLLEKDTTAFVNTINKELKTPALNTSTVRSVTLDEFSWQQVRDKYLALFKDLS